MSLNYQGNNLYIVDFGHQEVQLSGDEIQSLVDEVGEHIDKEYESPFEMPTSEELIKDNEILAEKLEQAEGSLNELQEICEKFIAMVEDFESR